MPIPTPDTGESHDDFIGRCMSDETMNQEYPDNEQRYAICETSWEDRDKENSKMSDNKMLIKALDFAVKQSDADARTLEFVGSTEKWDRDDEIILSSAWNLETYKKNPVVLFAHDHFSPAIGKATSVGVNKDGELRFKVKFAEPEVYGFADTIYKLYKGGYMKAVSVGLMPLEWEYGKSAEEPYRIITKADLFELSMVAVGANPEALISSRGVMKALKKGVVDQLEIDELIMMLKDMAEKQADKTVIPYHDYGYAAEGAAWDGPAQIRDADVDTLKKICAWYDGDAPDVKGSYKLPHHRANDLKGVWKGIAASMAALLGGRGGVDIPEAEKKRVYNHLASHYKDLEKDVPEFKSYTEEELKELFPEPSVTVVVENYSIEMLDSKKFQEFLAKHDLALIAKSVTPPVKEPELDIYEVLLQDLKTLNESDEKSDGDGDLTDELIALLKS